MTVSINVHINIYTYVLGGSIKSKPNCVCQIYLILYYIILKLSRYLENSTNNNIPTHRNILFNRLKDVSV